MKKLLVLVLSLALLLTLAACTPGFWRESTSERAASATSRGTGKNTGTWRTSRWRKPSRSCRSRQDGWRARL